jgi:hypothetical protein
MLIDRDCFEWTTKVAHLKPMYSKYERIRRMSVNKEAESKRNKVKVLVHRFIEQRHRDEAKKKSMAGKIDLIELGIVK